VYPDGIVGEVADSDSNDPVVTPSDMTQTLYHVFGAADPESIPFSPDPLSDAVTDTFCTCSAPPPVTASSNSLSAEITIDGDAPSAESFNSL
jgi:hypothetical protein